VKQFIVIIILLLTIISCEKNSIDDNLLERVYTNGKLTAEFFYTKKGKLERYKSYYNNGVVETDAEFIYDDDNDNIIKLKWGTGHYTKFVYENGLWIEENEYIQQQSFPQLVSYKRRDYLGGEIYEQDYLPINTLVADIVRVIENGNEVQTVYFNTITEDTLSIIYQYFDEFHNPFKNWLPTQQISYNTNNIIRQVTIEFEDDSTFTSEAMHTYTYNQHGYPATMQIEGEGISMRLEYLIP